MKRMRITAIILAMTLATTAFTGCNTKLRDKDKDKERTTVESTETTKEIESTENQEKTEKEEQSIFANLNHCEFLFSSGVGAWCTVLTIEEDGSFYGDYHDTDMGDSGETYPNGTMYCCSFHGKFTKPVAINDYTYEFEIASIQCDRRVGEEEIRDGIRYIYSEPYGLEQAKKIHLYLPSAPVDKLPPKYIEWICNLGDLKKDSTILGIYGLYNVEQEEGFSSYAVSDDIEAIDEELSKLENKALEMEELLESGRLAQQEMNHLSYELYKLWDEELNNLWGRLKSKLDEDKMEQLTKEERQWIKKKEQAVKEAGKEAEGGSLQPLLENTEAAQLTRERVYELANILKGI